MKHLVCLLLQAACLWHPAAPLPVLRATARKHEAGAAGHGVAALLQSTPDSDSLENQNQANGQERAKFIAEKKAAYDPLYFGLMIDAGSSGTRVRMFRWTLRSKVDLVEVVPLDGEEDLFQVHPGLSAYADDPEAALPPLAGILKEAQRYVPKAVWDESLLFLKATAGMRLLERQKADRLMDVVRKFLSDADNCPFKFVSAEILSGEEEAIFSYITTNYNLGSLATPDKTAGTLEMGGASMQVVFKPSVDIQDHEFQFYLTGGRQSVYAKSYLRFGVDRALERSIAFLAKQSLGTADVESPCHNRGFKDVLMLPSGVNRSFVGTGNSSACAEVVRKVMGLDIECLLPPCAIFGSYMAPASGDFYAIAGFFYTANGLGLVGWKDTKALTSEDIGEATEKWCAKDLQTAVSESGKPMKYAKLYCFMGTYVQQSLLVYGFSREYESSVIFSRKLGGINLGWPAGAMLYETQLMPLTLKATEGVRNLCGQPAQFGNISSILHKGGCRSFSLIVACLALVISIL